MKHLLLFIYIQLLFVIPCVAQLTIHSVIDVHSEIVEAQHYIVTKTNEKNSIDGLANEVDWKTALFSDPFIDIEGIKKPYYETKIKMLWDEKYLYVFAHMQEEHIWGNLKQRDTIIFFNNDFEIFIDPSGDTRNYGEIEINALGTVWDLLLDKPYRVGGKANVHWNLDELKYAIHMDGSLNNPNDIDNYWSVEMAIPMSALIELRNKPRKLPKEGEQWRVNFSRVQWQHDISDGKYYRKKENGKFLKENNWVFSNQGVINMHEPEKWGTLQFTHSSASNNITFIDDPDAIIKQVAYALFRKTRFDSSKDLLNLNGGDIKMIDVKYSKTKSITATFYKTNFGFEYKIVSPISKKTYLINEEGLLKKL